MYDEVSKRSPLSPTTPRSFLAAIIFVMRLHSREKQGGAEPRKGDKKGKKMFHGVYSLKKGYPFFAILKLPDKFFLTVSRCLGTKNSTGGEMPEEKQKQTTFRLSETDHQNLKILAAKERTTIQELILTTLDKVFPGWRKDK